MEMDTENYLHCTWFKKKGEKMKYIINKTNYHTFQRIEVNKLHPRSYFIPYPTREEADEVSLKEKRYKSKKVVCLNGKWNFQRCSAQNQ